MTQQEFNQMYDTARFMSMEHGNALHYKWKVDQLEAKVAKLESLLAEKVAE